MESGGSRMVCVGMVKGHRLGESECEQVMQVSEELVFNHCDQNNQEGLLDLLSLFPNR